MKTSSKVQGMLNFENATYKIKMRQTPIDCLMLLFNLRNLHSTEVGYPQNNLLLKKLNYRHRFHRQ